MPLILWDDGYVGGTRPKKGGFVEDIVSKKPNVRSALRSEAESVGRRAQANLDGSGRSGKNRTSIEVRHPPARRQGRFGTAAATLDSSVHLVSEGGMVGALSIEYGRDATEGEGWVANHGGQAGKYILHRAAGLKRG